MSHGNGAFGEMNSASGSSRPQYCCKPDQIVAVGAEAVQQDDELARPAAGERRPRRAGQVISMRASASRYGYRQSFTYSRRKPSPQRLMWPTEGDGKCIVQHSVSVSQ